MKKVIVLGAGMVGSAMAIDMAKKHDVTSVDINENSLMELKKHHIKTIKFNLSKYSEIPALVRDYDLVISAVPGFMGYNVLKAIIEAGKNSVDISFMPENTMQLCELAMKHNVTAIVDCGVAPGMPNFIAGYHNETMKIDRFEYMVGGLPKTRSFPFEYKAPFSPIDVIEEYTRPARYVENGHQIVKPPMSDPELIHFDNIGDLEAFNTDGLRSLILTFSNIKDMKEKTLRYPGHIKLIQALQKAGFFDAEPIEIDGKMIRPIDFNTKILFKSWKLGATEREFTVMRVSLWGTEDGKQKQIIYDLYDEFDSETCTSSMARTTGYTATAAANMFMDGLFTEKGTFPPELVGKYPQCFEYILNYLKERNIEYRKTEC